MSQQSDIIYDRDDTVESEGVSRESIDAATPAAITRTGSETSTGAFASKITNENDPAAMRQVYLSRKAQFEQAAAGGSAAAFRLLGNMYYHDWLGAPDYDRAESLYQKAMDAGDAIAKLCLANLWLEGHGHGSGHEALELVSQCARQTGRVVIRHENPDGTIHYGLSTSQRTIPVRKHHADTGQPMT